MQPLSFFPPQWIQSQACNDSDCSGAPLYIDSSTLLKLVRAYEYLDKWLPIDSATSPYLSI
jgi:hypothetical protein